MALGTPELLLILIVGLLVFGGLLVLVTLMLVSVKRAADRSAAADQVQERSGDADRTAAPPTDDPCHDGHQAPRLTPR